MDERSRGLAWSWLAARLGVLLAAAVTLAACGDGDKSAVGSKGDRRAVTVTVETAALRDFAVTETVVGTLEGIVDPAVAAEIAGRIVRTISRPGEPVRKGQLMAVIDDTDQRLARQAQQAEIARLEAQLAQQQRYLERVQALAERKFFSPSALDEAVAARDTAREALAAARAMGKLQQRDIDRTRVVAPIDGVVEVQIVGTGDYVRPGDVIYRLLAPSRLRAHFYLPESAATRMRVGLPVTLTTPTAPEQPYRGVIDGIKPNALNNSRMLDVMARVIDQPGWKPGASVTGVIEVERRDAVLVVPARAVVQRPAGRVAYVVEGDTARQRVVETGFRQDGLVEIVSGVAAGEVVVVDGAGFLTDGAPVRVKAGG